MRGAHTHFASGLHAVATFLPVLIVGTFWRLLTMHAAGSSRPWLRKLAGAAHVQY